MENEKNLFQQKALNLFKIQAQRCEVYAKYLKLIEVNPNKITTLNQIPFLPISLFKTQKIYCANTPPQTFFQSSTTASTKPSIHHIESIDKYLENSLEIFKLFYPGSWGIYALLPNYIAQKNSSLVAMVDNLIKHSNRGGFYLNNTDKMLHDISQDKGNKILLGVSYALLDLSLQQPDLNGVVVMETGGMKGRREEISKNELHCILSKAFNVKHIASEYGMAELSSQAYAHKNGQFIAPPTMRVCAYDLNDPFAPLAKGQSGRANIIDLANQHSCAFISTDDLCRINNDNTFEILGRVSHSTIRGCNLLIQ